MMGRLLRSADFERVLRTRSRAQSVHFALHHIGDRPSRPVKPDVATKPGLSTEGPAVFGSPVDDSPISAVPASVPQQGSVWLGAVVPKRHAKRSVTRTLLKRQIRAVAENRCGSLPGGLWVVRLRAPFSRAQFVSAASDALRMAARTELEQLFAATTQRPAGR